MTVQFRYFNGQTDYGRIGDFLINHHRPGNADGNWLEPMWEYMHHHSALDHSSLGRIGIWEEHGSIVAVTHYEGTLGEAFFQLDPAHGVLKQEMLEQAERDLSGRSDRDGRKYLAVYINEGDGEFISLAGSRGYERDPDGTRPMYRLDIPDPFPAIQLPEGFQLTSLAEECDWAKVNRVLWRGFDHEGEPPASGQDLAERRKMFDTPRARRDLKIAVKGPDGNFASFCGMFYEAACKFGYVEPVATDPDQRRRGLGKAAVLEGIRRVAGLGATTVYVGNDLPIYQALGFKKAYNSGCWLKYFAE